MYKFIGTDQKEYGPVSSDQIQRWAGQGSVNTRTRAAFRIAMGTLN